MRGARTEDNPAPHLPAAWIVLGFVGGWLCCGGKVILGVSEWGVWGLWAGCVRICCTGAPWRGLGRAGPRARTRFWRPGRIVRAPAPGVSVGFRMIARF